MNDDTPIRAALAEAKNSLELIADWGAKVPDGVRALASLAAETADAALAATEPAEPQRNAARYLWLRKNRPVTLITMFFGNGCVNKTIEMAEAEIDAELLVAEQSRSASSLTESAARDYCSCMKEDCPKCYAIEPAATEIRAAPSEPAEKEILALANKWAGAIGPHDCRTFGAARLVSFAREVAALRPSAVPSDPLFLQVGEATHTRRGTEVRWNGKVDVSPGTRVYIETRPSAVLEAAPEPSDEQILEVADQEFPNWRYDIQEEFVLRVVRAFLRASTPSPSPTGEKP